MVLGPDKKAQEKARKDAAAAAPEPEGAPEQETVPDAAEVTEPAPVGDPT
jgi:hypothetical protein